MIKSIGFLIDRGSVPASSNYFNMYQPILQILSMDDQPIDRSTEKTGYTCNVNNFEVEEECEICHSNCCDELL